MTVITVMRRKNIGDTPGLRRLQSLSSVTRSKDRRAPSPLPSDSKLHLTSTNQVTTSDVCISTTPEPLYDLPLTPKLPGHTGFSPSPHRIRPQTASHRHGTSLASASRELGKGKWMEWKSPSELLSSLVSPVKSTQGGKKPGLSWLIKPLSHQLTGYLKTRRLKRRSPSRRPRESVRSVVITMLG